MKTGESVAAARESCNSLRVLVAEDGSASAQRACSLLTHLLPAGAEIRLVTVCSMSDYPFSLVDGSLSDEDQRVRAARDYVASTQAAARRVFEAAGFRVVSVQRCGYPLNEILAELNEHDADVVVLGHRRLHDPAHWVGSVSESVVHRAHVPILLVA